jgi:glycine cleavage system H protein
MQVPAELKYTKDHEWVRFDDGAEGTIGITDFAQDALGDVVFVELPAVGKTLTKGQVFGVVESNKSVSDLFAPVSGRVVAVNGSLSDRPELVNQEPYGGGWIVRVAVDNAADLAALLDAPAYEAVLAAEHAK